MTLHSALWSLLAASIASVVGCADMTEQTEQPDDEAELEVSEPMPATSSSSSGGSSGSSTGGAAKTELQKKQTAQNAANELWLYILGKGTAASAGLYPLTVPGLTIPCQQNNQTFCQAASFVKYLRTFVGNYVDRADINGNATGVKYCKVQQSYVTGVQGPNVVAHKLVCDYLDGGDFGPIHGATRENFNALLPYLGDFFFVETPEYPTRPSGCGASGQSVCYGIKVAIDPKAAYPSSNLNNSTGATEAGVLKVTDTNGNLLSSTSTTLYYLLSTPTVSSAPVGAPCSSSYAGANTAVKGAVASSGGAKRACVAGSL